MSKKDSVYVQMKEVLDEYNKEVQDAANKSITSVSRETVRKLKEVSPKRPGNGAYARSWTLKKTGKYAKGENINGVIVYNAKHYQLTHLLNNGHDVRNRKGGPIIGRAFGDNHIGKVEQWAIEELPQEIERKLRR